MRSVLTYFLIWLLFMLVVFGLMAMATASIDPCNWSEKARNGYVVIGVVAGIVLIDAIGEEG